MAWRFPIIVLLAVLNFWLTQRLPRATAEDRQNQIRPNSTHGREAEYELAMKDRESRPAQPRQRPLSADADERK